VFAIGAFVELGKGFYYQQLLGWLSLGAKKLYLKQTSIGHKEKGVYQATIPLEDALVRRALLIHSVDGEPLPLNKLALRLLDFGLYGYKNVKGANLEIDS